MTWKAITADKTDKGAFDSALKSALVPIGLGIEADFNKIVAGWNNRPEFPVKVKVSSSEITINVFVESSWSPGQKAGANDIFMFNSRGTKVRYATMSSNFSPKSQKGLIGGKGGSGGLLSVNKSRPQKGIEAREHEETVMARQEPIIGKGVQKAYEIAAALAEWTL